MDREEFGALVRDALANLYDLSYLSRHQLNSVLSADPLHPGGQNLHRVLLEAIEQLRPPARVQPTANAWRPYLVLSLRYSEERTTEQTAQELGISLRQLRREHAHGVQMLVEVLRGDYMQRRGSAAADGQPTSVVDSEVARLGAVRSEALTSLDVVVQSVLETVQRHAKAHEVAFETSIQPRLPRLPVERAALRQVLLNLLTHVIDVGGPGLVTIAARRLHSELEVTIGHDGKHPLLSDTDSQDERLAVAGQLVTAQGGRLQVGREGRLRLAITLPVQAIPVVLVIDDNAEMIQLFRRYLAAGAYDVVGASTGQEGLRLAQETRPSVVMLDVMMPDQDGWETLQNLKNLSATKDIPVIVCSVLKEQELACSLGASQFLAKPVTQQMLLAALAACLVPGTSTANPAPPSGNS